MWWCVDVVRECRSSRWHGACIWQSLNEQQLLAVTHADLSNALAIHKVLVTFISVILLTLHPEIFQMFKTIYRTYNINIL